MIAFDQGNARFNYRVAGLALDGNRVLLHRSEVDDFWSLPDGRITMMETAEEALAREMYEELGVEVRVGRLLWVVENFFDYDDRPHHELGLYFLMSFPNHAGLLEKGEEFKGNENELRLVFMWHPIADLDQTRIKPSFLHRALGNIPNEAKHVVHKNG